MGCDGANYGKITIFNFPKGEMVYGPAQIDALINQDPAIAQQFTLWDQAGSSVVRGKMIILLIGNSVLFIQPVYLKSTSRVNIPELQRIIMSEGQVVVMETSLEKAYNLLQRRVAEKIKGLEQRFPQVRPAADTTPPPHATGRPGGAGRIAESRRPGAGRHGSLSNRSSCRGAAAIERRLPAPAR